MTLYRVEGNLHMLKHETIPILTNIDTAYKSHNTLAQLATTLSNTESATIVLDFSKVTYIASNQFAVLGCIVDSYKKTHPNSNIYFANLGKKIKELIQKNGFHQHLNFQKLPDEQNTVIPYTIFGINNIDQFEKYIILKIFNRRDIPAMSTMVKSAIIDNILEIFNNVKEHTKSEHIYTCGHFFASKSYLYFTIVDSGETIPYNVNKHFYSLQKEPPAETLSWALKPGNTTRTLNTPGGLGLSLLQNFITLNRGEMYIVSGNETYEIKGPQERHMYMKHHFPGTIVTVAFNLSDTMAYHMQTENFSDIIF